MFVEGKNNHYYYRLLSYGDFIPLEMHVNANKLLEEIEPFKRSWKPYNPRKKNNRFGLSITSLDGKLDGFDLDSFHEYNHVHSTEYTEMSFKEKTDVYHKSKEIKKIIDPWESNLSRSHIINLKQNGSFPPHRDWKDLECVETFRVIVPIANCNPVQMYFVYDNDKILNFNHGQAYFLNTNKEHCLFSFHDECYFIVLNIDCNDQSLKVITERLQ